MKGICVFGAANVDIGGFPEKALVRGDSNPGRIHISVGGVGYNVACNASRLGLNVELCAPLGGDVTAALVERSCRENRVGLRYARRFPEENMSAYIFIADGRGDMVAAINDMDILARMTPEVMRDVRLSKEDCDLAVIDANLPAETIAYLAERLTVPIFAEAVSAAKVCRLKSSLRRLHALKLNRLEAEALTGRSVSGLEEAKLAVRALLGMGVRRVYLTLGAEGVCCGEGDAFLHLPAMATDIVNATGAGDAFAAALLWAHGKNMDLQRSAIAGEAAAAIAIRSQDTVSPDMNEENLNTYMELLKALTGGMTT